MKTAPKKLHDRIAALYNDHGAIQAQDFVGTTLNTLRLMVTTGMSLSLMPALHVRSDVLREKFIVARLLVRAAPVREFMMTWRNSSPRHEAHCRLGRIPKAIYPRDCRTSTGNRCRGIGFSWHLRAQRNGTRSGTVERRLAARPPVRQPTRDSRKLP